MRLFKVVASFLSLSFPRESELLSVILANLRRPIKRMECNVSADFFFPSLFLSLSIKKEYGPCSILSLNCLEKQFTVRR